MKIRWFADLEIYFSLFYETSFAGNRYRFFVGYSLYDCFVRRIYSWRAEHIACAVFGFAGKIAEDCILLFFAADSGGLFARI